MSPLVREKAYQYPPPCHTCLKQPHNNSALQTARSGECDPLNALYDERHHINSGAYCPAQKWLVKRIIQHSKALRRDGRWPWWERTGKLWRARSLLSDISFLSSMDRLPLMEEKLFIWGGFRCHCCLPADLLRGCQEMHIWHLALPHHQNILVKNITKMTESHSTYSLTHSQTMLKNKMFFEGG